MANAGSADKVKKKKSVKKSEQDYDTFASYKMKAPVIEVLGKNNLNSKNFSLSSHFNNLGSSGNEKRSRRYQHDWELTNGSYTGRGLRTKQCDSWQGDQGQPPGEESAANQSAVVITPVILSRGKVSGSTEAEPPVVAPSPKKEHEPQKETSVQQQQYQIVSKPSSLEATVPTMVLESSVKFLEDGVLAEDLSPYLLDQNHFLVLAFIGLQASGKSTIASLMADPSLATEGDIMMSDKLVFQPESWEEVMNGYHTTNGIDMFVTKERVILLDVQPLLSASVMDYIVTQKRKVASEYSSTENLLEVETLQLLTFVMSVSHALIVVQDFSLHPGLLRLLHTCQMMKPTSSPATSNNISGGSRLPFRMEEVHQFFPHVVFVHNRAFAHHFAPDSVRQLQGIYHHAMSDSSLLAESSIGMLGGNLMLNTMYGGSEVESQQPLNLFFIPDVYHQEQCPVSFASAIREMHHQIISLKRLPFTHVMLTEKSWYQYSCRMWENIRKSSLYLEYSRLLP